MNLLAHALLACATLENTDGQECTGAMIADFMAGRSAEGLPPGLLTGLRQHRAVDTFTDSHPVFISCRQAIAAAGAPRHTAGILVDIFWDHVLATEWETWGRPLCGLALQPFSDLVGHRLGQTREWHGPAFARAYTWMVGRSWLSSYARIEDVGRALAGMSGRMSGHPRLGECVGILVTHDVQIRRDFSAFWPDLVGFARGWSSREKAENGGSPTGSYPAKSATGSTLKPSSSLDGTGPRGVKGS